MKTNTHNKQLTNDLYHERKSKIKNVNKENVEQIPNI